MKNRSGEKIKLTSIDELLGVVNEESTMEIEIDKIKSPSVTLQTVNTYLLASGIRSDLITNTLKTEYTIKLKFI